MDEIQPANRSSQENEDQLMVDPFQPDGTPESWNAEGQSQEVNSESQSSGPPSSRNSQAPSQTICNTCFCFGVPKRPVRVVSKSTVELYYNSLVLVSEDINGNVTTLRPFYEIVQDIRRTRGEVLQNDPDFSSFQVFICGACSNDFDKIYRRPNESWNVSSLSSKRLKVVQKASASFVTRREKNRLSGSGITAETKFCFLREMGTACSDPPAPLHHPTRLRHRSGSVKKIWKALFSEKLGIGENVAEDIINGAEDIFLCPTHTAAMKNQLRRAEEGIHACSVCGVLGSQRSAGAITSFQWERLSLREDTACVIEDALAAYTENSVAPSDVSRLCSTCRRVICRNVEMKEAVPRDARRIRTVDGYVDYGPTPLSIQRCLRFVRERLEQRGTLLVFFKDVRDLYERTVIELSEERYTIRDNRTLKKYMLPALSLYGIFLEVGAKKFGAFFCNEEVFNRLASQVQNIPDDSISSGVEETKRLLRPFKEFLQSREAEIEESNWKLRDFIVMVPWKLWAREVTLLCPNSLLRKCKAIATIKGSRYELEWPFNPVECPQDIQSLPSYEFSLALSVYYSIERLAFLQSSRRVRGPLTTAMSLCAMRHSTVSYLGLLNKIGCTVSYQLIEGMRKEATLQRKERGAFQELQPNAFVSVGIDNVNKRSHHSLAVHGSSYHGFDGLAMQAVNSNTSFDFAKLTRETPAMAKRVKRPRHACYREEFIAEKFPLQSDPDIEAYRWAAIGSALKNRSCIATSDKSNAKSFRRVLLEMLRGFTGGRSRVVFVDIRHCKPSDDEEVRILVAKIRDHYNPPGCETYVIVAIVGDQPIFKALFKIWIESYVKKTDYCHWLVPIPGGFHIDKQAIIPMIKTYMSGSGLEELVQFSGLSATHQDGIVELSHYRRNRRFLSQITAAEILRLHEVMSVQDPQLAKEVEELLGGREDARLKLCDVVPQNSQVAFSDSLSPSTVLAGKYFCDAVRVMAAKHINLKFYGEVQLFNMLIPWTAYNILTRKGQTAIVDKFWFSFVGLLHSTCKYNYQENMLFYAFVKDRMPDLAYELLYNKRHLVYNLHPSATDTNGHLDEGVESGIIRSTKMLKTNNPSILEASAPWSGVISKASDVIESQVVLSRTSDGISADLESSVQGNEARKYDREKPTAVNVFAMLNFLREKQWLGREHMMCSYIMNQLRETPLVIEDDCYGDKITNVEETGRGYAVMHLSTKLGAVFQYLTDVERKEVFDNKSLQKIDGTWKQVGHFKSMREMDPDGNSKGSDLPVRGRKKKEDANRIMQKRTRFLMLVKEALSNIMMRSAGLRKRAAEERYTEVTTYDHLLSARPYAYLANLKDDVPCSSTNHFWKHLQDCLSSLGLIRPGKKICTEGADLQESSYYALHVDVTEDVEYSPGISVGGNLDDVVLEKMQFLVNKFVSSYKYRSVRDFHYHVDVNEWMHRAKYRSIQARDKKTVNIPGAMGQEVNPRDSLNVEVPSMEPIAPTAINVREKRKWRELISDWNMRGFLMSLHVLFAACATVRLLEGRRNGRCSNDGEDESPQLEEQIGEDKFRVFIHGANLAITEAARKCSLNQLNFSKLCNSVLISKNDESVVGISSTAEELIQRYDASACWCVSSEGISRFVAGDARHGEAKTRVVHSINCINIPQMLADDTPPEDWNVLVICHQYEAPLVTSLNNGLSRVSVVHQIQEENVYLDGLRDAAQSMKRNMEDFALLYAVAGCDQLPHTKQISQECYIKAFVTGRNCFGELYNSHLLRGGNFELQSWIELERLVALAYVLKHQSSQGLPKKDYLGLESENALMWPQKVRRWVSRLPDLKCVSQLMPETADIELQVRRAYCLLKHWKLACTAACDKGSSGELDISCGYTADGAPIFERPEDFLWRSEYISKPYPKCACKGGCKNSRCKCVRTGTLCILCNCTGCENQGEVLEPVDAPVLPTSIIVEEVEDEPVETQGLQPTPIVLDEDSESDGSMAEE